MAVTALDLTDPDSFVGGPPCGFSTSRRKGGVADRSGSELMISDPDAPQQKRPGNDGRLPNAHIAFGPHDCLGASVAEVEIEAMFREIRACLPELRQESERERLRSTPISGSQHVPVACTPDRRAGE